jgi:hypothetical protein
VCYSSHNRDEEPDERRAVETPLDLVETVRSLMAKLQSCKDDNERLIKEQEKKQKLMQSCCRVYPTYRDSCNMDLQPVMWTDDIQREVKVHLRYKNVVP